MAETIKGTNEFAALRRELKARLHDSREVEPAAKDLREAAVAIILREHKGVPELLIIKRAVSERDHWSGHLALPGGRREPDDPGLYFTAARETMEEVGVDFLSGGELLGRLDTVTPRSPRAPQFSVTPFVAIAPHAFHIPDDQTEPKHLTLSHEVEVAFWIPLPLLVERGRSEIFRFIVEEEVYEWPSYPSEQGPIWGLTERILTNFLEVAGAADAGAGRRAKKLF